MSKSMAAIHPPPPQWFRAAPREGLEDDVGATFRRYQSARTLTRARTCGWQKHLLRPDIAGCIPLSKLRCIITLVSLVLLVTDIPRTGLGVRNLQKYYPVPLMPSTAVRFGPFNYPVAHIWRLDNGSGGSNTSATEFAGLKGVQPIVAARVWSYQYDTTSVGLRGAVELLNVTEFPAFLLYKDDPEHPSKNADSLIELGTAFAMLDAFITAAHTELRPQGAKHSQTLRYATKYNWVDRMHDYVVSFLSKHSLWSLHSLHAPVTSRGTKSMNMCSNNIIGRRSPPRPRFCNRPGIWKCANPLNNSLPAVYLWEHMDLRLQYLQRRYPDMELDVALISTQRPSRTSGAMRSTFYTCEATEIVVLTRGRHCVRVQTTAAKSDPCTTVFVDDYRYETSVVQTNIVDWYAVVAILRGGAQAYLWIRLLLLGYGAYEATGKLKDQQQSSRRSHMVSAVLIVLKIPFHVIVYSSPLPVAGYGMALLLDSNFMDIFQETYWASLGGVANFHLVPFVESTAVQMRNVWLMALLASLVVFAVRNARDHGGYGIPGIRGLLISFTSSLTVFGPYKNMVYRDTDIVTIFRMVHQGQAMDSVLSGYGGYFNTSSYIFDDSATMLLFCIIVVVGVVFIIQTLGSLTPKTSYVHILTRGVILKTSATAPCGTHRLWLKSLSNIYFDVIRHAERETGVCIVNSDSESLRGATQLTHSTSSNTIRVSPAPSPLINPKRAWETTTNLLTTSSPQTKISAWHRKTFFSKTKVRSQTEQPTKPPPGGLRWRTTESHSILQLMNVAMMTDPWNLFCLRVLGIQLYLYKIRPTQPTELGARTDSSSCSFGLLSYAVILPYSEDEMEERTGLSMDEYELLDSASSRDVPMSIILQCG